MASHMRQPRAGGLGDVYLKRSGKAIAETSRFYRAVPTTLGLQPVAGVVEPIESRATRLPICAREVTDPVVAAQRANAFVCVDWEHAQLRRAQSGRGSAILLLAGENPRELQWPWVPSGVLAGAPGESRATTESILHTIVSDGTSPAVVPYGRDELLIWRSRAAPEIAA